MAAAERLELCVSAFAKPPSGHIRSYKNNKEFKYRGTLFRPSSAHQDNAQTASKAEKIFNPGEELEIRDVTSSTYNQVQTNLHSSQYQSTQIKPRRIQSAKARLERPLNQNELQSFELSDGHVHFAESNKNIDRKPSVLNINAAVDIPDKEESDLILRANVLCRAYNDLNQKQRIRPSSAKSAFGCPVSSAENTEKDQHPAKEILKPSIYGLKLGRQVYGNDAYIQEAWANTERNYPFRLKEDSRTDPELKKSSKELEASNLPQTLKPLQRWLRHGTSSDVTGLDSHKSLVFLSRDYTADELPEVPPPQELSDNLPHNCLVATPRHEPQKRYRHPYFEHEPESLEWKCNHTKAAGSSNKGDISFLLNPPYRRNYQEIRLEIAELENLLQGIGSLSSDCSFVKFQAEIRCARALARKLILPHASDTEVPADSFGLLQFYKEHDKAMEIIRERRRICLEELQIIEKG
ncbi:glutamate receptor delta-1 subunit [Elysia marginata]|uniref:Glutamate receptor delta-1 subunit n=1 Tax=Elysia marginata TaxID=1093978 RepID=A0AAV4JX91_9GAST|nr:glutamate receptor delta-1 subunit [Elysia marginata]